MKHFVKIISIIIVLLLTLSSIIALIYFGECTVRDYGYLTDPSAGGEFGALGYIFSWPIMVFIVIIRIIAGIIIIIEMVLLIRQFVKAVKAGSYELYWKNSLVGFIETIINCVIFLTLTVGPGDINEDRFLREVSIAAIIYICVFVLSIINMLVSHQGQKREKENRIYTDSVT